MPVLDSLNPKTTLFIAIKPWAKVASKTGNDLVLLSRHNTDCKLAELDQIGRAAGVLVCHLDDVPTLEAGKFGCRRSRPKRFKFEITRNIVHG